MRLFIARILRWQATIILKRQRAKIVVITGSVGKTSTTQAIATILREQFRVQQTVKNYNSDVGVPCSIFNEHIPESLFNPFSWLSIIIRNLFKMLFPKRIDVYVLELGTDKPGEIAQFAWLKPDIAVVTAVAAEHMEFFKTLDVVAQEELAVSHYSETTLVNKDMVALEYLKYADSSELYNYSREDITHVDLEESALHVYGKHSIDAIAAGLAVGKRLGMNKELLRTGALKVSPQAGRMNVLRGKKDSILIDDTYNSSPEAVEAALEYLYSLEHKQKIALLGNMNELGETSESSHTAIGEKCNPKQLDLVVTLGADANRYTAEAAEKNGCTVIRTTSPYEAAEKINKHLNEGAAVLLKGSQNGVFAEESVKLLLAQKEDVEQLVRQNDFWLKKKAENFPNAHK